MIQSAITYDALLFTDGDYDRLGTIKKASDVVFSYFRWVLEDHRRTQIEKEHQRKIENLICEVSDVFGVNQEREPLVRYFIANTLKGAQDAELARLADAYLPFSMGAFVEMYDITSVQQCMEDLTPHNQLMYSGNFMEECSSTSDILDDVQKGTLVGCDLNFVMSIAWPYLLDLAEMENDGSFVCVGKALVTSVNGFHGASSNGIIST